MFVESDVRQGMTVWSSDGEKLGKVVGREAGGFVIEKGIFFPKDYFARFDQIASVDGDDVRLSVAKGSFTELSGREERVRGEAGEGPATTERGAGAGLHAATREETRVPLVEEELTAEKRMREAGEVRVRKDVVTERREVPVEVMREEVHVERVPVEGGEVRAGEARFAKDEISIPVREEEVELRKRPVVREEIRVGKTAHREERRASEDVRRETAEIERQGDVERTDTPRPDDPWTRRDPE